MDCEQMVHSITYKDNESKWANVQQTHTIISESAFYIYIHVVQDMRQSEGGGEMKQN